MGASGMSAGNNEIQIQPSSLAVRYSMYTATTTIRPASTVLSTPLRSPRRVARRVPNRLPIAPPPMNATASDQATRPELAQLNAVGSPKAGTAGRGDTNAQRTGRAGEALRAGDPIQPTPKPKHTQKGPG